MAHRVLAALGGISILLGACDAPPRSTPGMSDRSSRSPQGSGVGSAVDRPIAATREGTILWSQVQPAMIELAGGTALRDALLDARITQLLGERSITLDAASIEAERAILLSALDANPDVAQRLLDDIRARQGLGPVRYAALLKRNAGLRALVQPDVRVTPDALARHHESLHGPRRVCRVIALPTLAEIESARRELESGVPFADVAARRSTDRSAERGGLLAPIARTDPSWPEAFREALFRLPPGERSPPITVDGQYLILLFVEEQPGDGSTLAQRRAEVETALRRGLERVLMEELARSLLSELRPTIYDSAFEEAWRQTGA